MNSRKYNWGIDLGGTKVEGIVMQGKDTSNTIARLREPTEQEGGYDHILNQIVKVVDRLRSESGLSPETIGIGTPGTTDPSTGLLKNCNTVVLNGMPLKKDLEDRLGIPLVMSNDANCFAMAETHLGSVASLGIEPQVVVGLILGTGVGSGIVINGKTLNGHHGIGGEWGHNTLIKDGSECYCGKQGCVETVIAGPALEKYYHSLSGNKLKLAEIVKASRGSTDPNAKKTISRLLEYFGLAISNVINVLDPEVIVIGGGVGNIDELYTTESRLAILPHVFNKELQTKIIKPTLGDSAGVFGAAMLV